VEENCPIVTSALRRGVAMGAYKPPIAIHRKMTKVMQNQYKFDNSQVGNKERSENVRNNIETGVVKSVMEPMTEGRKAAELTPLVL
jgi:hypothetical protein